MQITRIDLLGFGCLSRYSCELGPGLNVFYGENEAGKSTLQHAICALLYGFYDSDRARQDETARHERFRPWFGELFRGALEYELEDGRCFEVRRDFSTPDVATQVLDVALGTDVSAQFGRGRHGNVPFARRHLGMGRGVFQSCAFISQGEIFEIEKNASPNQIGDAIAALADSARRDVSAARAIERLDAAVALVGTDRARTAELPKARASLERARAELQAIDDARRVVAENTLRLDELKNSAAALSLELVSTEYRLQRSEAARLREQLRALDEVDSTFERARAEREDLESFASMPSTLRDDVVSLRAQLGATESKLTRLRHQGEPGCVTGEEMDEFAALQLSVGWLTELQAAHLQARALRRRASGIRRLLRAAFAALGGWVRGFLATLLRRPIEPGDDKDEGAEFSAQEALALLEKHRRYLTLRPAVEGAAHLEREVEAETDALDALERRLRSVLRMASVQVESLADAGQQFEEAWQKRERCHRAEAVVEDALRRRALLLDGRTRDEIEARIGECMVATTHMLELHPSLKGHAGPEPDARSVRNQEQTRAELRRTELEAERLDEEVQQTLGRFRSRAEAEEEAAWHDSEVQRLETARASLLMAKDVIQEAMTSVYRDFAPAVNAFLSEGIEAATGGRYHRAHVDPSTLKVSLLVPETGLVVTDPPVSHGTRTLIYFLMRIGLAQHMSAVGEPVPIILDDPFVDVDETRLARMLEFLLALSGRMQVLLFTKGHSTARWFEENAAMPGNLLHEMSGALVASGL